MSQIRTALVVLLLVGLALFSVVNNSFVAVNLGFQQFDVWLPLLVLVMHPTGHDLADLLSAQVVASDEPVESSRQHVLIGGLGVGAELAGEGDAVAAEDGSTARRGGHEDSWGVGFGGNRPDIRY